MVFSYEVLINVAADEDGRPAATFCRLDEPSYRPGDALVRTWQGEIPGNTALDAAWLVVARHNRDDRPDGQLGPSFSSGDVVVLTPIGQRGRNLVAFASMDGMEMVQVEPPVGYETGRTWREVVSDAPVAV